MRKGTKHALETRRKMSEAKQGEKNPMYGKNFLLEHRQRLSEALAGRKLSPETKRKMSEAKKGIKFSLEHRRKLSEARRGNQNRRGTKQSLETRQKISKATQGEKNPMWGRHHSLETRRKWSLDRRGEKNHQWRGGRRSNGLGYVIIYKPNHPNADVNGYVLEHRFLIAEHLGRPLRSEEIVHHINRIRNDNRIENLMLFPSRTEHVAHHKLEGLRVT